jgi:hypothetical protein
VRLGPRLSRHLMEKQGFSAYLWGFLDGKADPKQLPRRSKRCRQKPICPQKDLERSEGSAASSSAAPPSSMPSCRRPAWSTTISPAVSAMPNARRWGRALTWPRRETAARLAAHAVGPAARSARSLAARHRDRGCRPWPGARRALERPDLGPHIFSVAQHSLLVEAIARRSAADLPRRARLLAVLLHDAPEYVIGDMISPLKAVLGDGYKASKRATPVFRWRRPTRFSDARKSR